MTASDGRALYDPAGGRFEPTPFARGPWDPGLLHGGAVAALAAELLQDRVGPSYQPARMTLDLLRPVPMVPLSVEATLVRAGARLGLAECKINADAKVVAAATLLALRPQPLDDAPPNPAFPSPDGPDDAANLWDLAEDAAAFIGGALSFRFIRTGDSLAGGVAWLRLHRAVLPGRPPSPLARVAAAADVPSAVAAFDGVRFPGVGFINADVSVHLSRPLEGEWVRMTATSRWEPSGMGTVTAVVADRLGACARVGQALLLAAGLTPP